MVPIYFQERAATSNYNETADWELQRNRLRIIERKRRCTWLAHHQGNLKKRIHGVLPYIGIANKDSTPGLRAISPNKVKQTDASAFG